MRKVRLERLEDESGDCGTFGRVITDSGFECYSGELPDRGNASGKSCIPKGVYKCAIGDSPKHGRCYYVQKVAGRTDIEIHPANWMGDADKGLKCQLLGCIAMGRAIGDVAGQKGLMSSRDATIAFMADLEGEDFELTIS